ncbi:transcription factor S [Candidatus Woesearchaeota archaeon]|nr:transcription factor S [Candidatus Woesearchaeota archaeon]
MMFCPKCKSLLMPKVIEGKRVLACSCGHSSAGSATKLTEKVSKKHDMKIEVADKDFETLPATAEHCPKCGNDSAYYWLQQTRSGDEAETKFLRCTKCKHTWRDYK